MLKQTAALGVSWLALASVAGAQPAEDPRDARIRDLEQRLEQLTDRLEVLEHQTPQATAPQPLAAPQQAAPASPPPPPAPHVSLNNGRPTIESADGDFRFAIRGVFQLDAAAYDQESGATPDLSSGSNFRRARLGIEGTMYEDWNYEFTLELGGSGAEDPGKIHAAWIEYAGLGPMRIRAGAYAPSVGLDDSTSTSDLLFLERGAGAELMRGIAAGDGRSALGVIANGDRWFASAAATGGVAGQAASFDEQVGFVARGAVLALNGSDYGLHFGASTSQILEPTDASNGPGATSVRLQERPELRVDGTRLVDTGQLTADSVSAYGLEAGLQWQRLLVTGEATWFNVDRGAGLPDAEFGGWHVQAAWSLSGEQRRWQRTSGAFASQRVAHVFDPAAGQWGAWEVAARYSVLDLNDREHDAGLASTPGAPTAIVRGGEQDITSFGLNWRPNGTIRVMFDYQNIEIERLDSTGAADIGQDIDAVSVRTQLAF